MVSNQEHHDIAEAVAAHDVKRAQSAFKRHVLKGKARAVAAIAADHGMAVGGIADRRT